MVTLIPGVAFMEWNYNGFSIISVSGNINLRKKHRKDFTLQLLSLIRYPNGLSENKRFWGLKFKKLFYSENPRTPNIICSSVFKGKDPPSLIAANQLRFKRILFWVATKNAKSQPSHDGEKKSTHFFCLSNCCLSFSTRMVLSGVQRQLLK